MSKVWFITGTSSGFGREWTTAALARGDRVAATSRRGGALDGLAADHGDALLQLPLQVTDREAVLAAVQQAHEHFGRLDVIVNNAGYGTYGMVEELVEQDVRDQLETNVLGPLWVTQAALPILRGQGGGHIIQVSSVGAHMSFPNLGLYCSSKNALEGFSASLAAEVAPFGIRVTMVEPGAFATGGETSARHSPQHEAYEPLRRAAREDADSRRSDPGDPTASTRVLLEIVDAEDPPLRVFFGPGNLALVEDEYARRLANWRALQPMAEQAHG